MIKEHMFPHCCGITILEGFGRTTCCIRGNRDELNKVKENLEKIVKKYENRIRNEEHYASILMVVLNKPQMSKLGKIFKNNGWEIIAKNLHHIAHLSDLTILIKCLTERKED